MTKLETLLDDMLSRLTTANFSGLKGLAPELEAALSDSMLANDPAALKRIKTKAVENMAFLDAARRGVRAARRRVEDVRRATQGLQTYNGKGQRSDIAPLGPTAGRF